VGLEVDLPAVCEPVVVEEGASGVDSGVVALVTVKDAASHDNNRPPTHPPTHPPTSTHPHTPVELLDAGRGVLAERLGGAPHRAGLEALPRHPVHTYTEKKKDERICTQAHTHTERGRVAVGEATSDSGI
jgi:hypothetical protein